jgi:integrase
MLNETTSDVIVYDDRVAGNVATYDPDALGEHWLTYFDAQAAVDEVLAHVGALPGQRRKSKHTERAYRDGLAYFLQWCGAEVGRELVLMRGQWFRMPSRATVKAFIAHLYGERNLAASTVNAKYLAPLRHFLRGLSGQTPMPGNGGDMMLITMLKDEFRAALAVKGPSSETTSNLAPLWREGTRLTGAQVNAVLRSLDLGTLDGIRDYALLSVAFYTGLRRAELAQITLNSIRQEGDVWVVETLGKRSNTDPVTLPDAARRRIMDWVAAYNEGMADDDPRRIAGDVPVWQSLRHGGNRKAVGDYRFDPTRGMTPGSIGAVMTRRVEAVCDVAFSAHDARRTLAALLHREGALVNVIQKILRHKDAAVTLNYIGEPPDYAATDAGAFVSFG